MIKPHICIITTAHPIDDVRVNHKFASSFRSVGFRVSWVGSNHSFFDTNDYDGNGIEFILSPPVRSRLDRLRSYKLIKKNAEMISNVDVFYAPDPDAALIALIVSKKNNAKVIFDIHESYHIGLLERWMFGFRLKFFSEIIRRLISLIASNCDLVICVNELVRKHYVTKKIPNMVVRSCAPLWFFKNKDENTNEINRNFIVMHGKSNFERGTLKALEAAAIASKQISEFNMVMFESNKNMKTDSFHPLIKLINDLDLKEVIDIRPSVPMKNMPDILHKCDVGMILYDRTFGKDSLPNRIFEYMAAGIAIIAPTYSTEIAKIINAEHCGLLVDCEDPEQISDAIVHLKNDMELCREMGKRAQIAFLKRHNWESEIKPVMTKIRMWAN